MSPERKVTFGSDPAKHASQQPTGKILDLRNKAVPKDAQNSARINQLEKEKQFLEKVLFVEARMRSMETLQALKYFVANELKTLLLSGQIIIFKRTGIKKQMKVDTVSSLATVNQYSPMLHWLSSEIAREIDGEDDTGAKPSKQANANANPPLHFRLNTGKAPEGAFAFPNVLAVKLLDRSGSAFAAIAFLSDVPFQSNQLSLASRLGGTFAHSWLQFDKAGQRNSIFLTKPASLLILSTLIIGLFVPVPLTVLAPASIAAYEPEIVAAPLQGVIEFVHVRPNSRVAAGDILFSYEKTDAKNHLEQAKRNVVIAAARLARSNQDAFGSGSGRRDMAVAKAEWELALAEQRAAERKLSLADVYAPTDGVTLFEGVEKWIGKPVATGERVMSIADPHKVEFRIDLPVKEAIILAEMKSARIFLDSNPLHSLSAEITRTSYEAEMSNANVLVFPLYAKVRQDEKNHDLRIGLRGTVQLSGDKVSLWFFLLRKPLSYLRQFTGL